MILTLSGLIHFLICYEVKKQIFMFLTQITFTKWPAKAFSYTVSFYPSNSCQDGSQCKKSAVLIEDLKRKNDYHTGTQPVNGVGSQIFWMSVCFLREGSIFFAQVSLQLTSCSDSALFNQPAMGQLGSLNYPVCYPLTIQL